MEIRNKVAVLTGASFGIGHATARLLTKKGAHVALVARSKNRLLALSNELKDSFVDAVKISRSEIYAYDRTNPLKRR